MNTARKLVWFFLIIVGLYITARQNYLLFHTSVEVFSVAVSLVIGILSIGTYEISQNSFLLIIGISYLPVAVLDFLHLVTYAGMGVFPNYTANVPTQLWVAGRFFEAGALMVAPSFIDKQVDKTKATYLISLLAVLVIGSIMVVPVFPECFQEGSGLTSFKIISELAICGLLVIAAYRITRHGGRLLKFLRQNTQGAIIFTILGELSFTLYNDVYGGMNLLGHLFKVISYTLILRSVILEGLKRPFLLALESLQRERAESRDRFIRIMVHELRNPLTTIKAVCGLMRFQSKQENSLPEVLEQLSTIENESDHLNELLEKVSIAFRSQQGTLVVDRKAVDLGKIVKKVADSLRLSTDKVDIVLGAWKEGIWVQGDPDRLEQVIRNLLGNAIKYSFAGGKIYVQVEVTPEWVEVRVEDQGIGIPEDQVSRIFDGFFRASNIQGRDPGGTGLGLFICREIIEAHLGEIWVDSIEGKGSTFSFRLPLLSLEVEREEKIGYLV